ncbi:unnamed protein product [Aspergillus oryzae RIB40]|uniref:DNA, SC005 n=2 Tax=Aspergillus oryzae TaxID=5062 RepID=Q2URQ2_ASPOR|nr:unnamed protein product [Aspergillus oryzae RIB40]EIT74006.1 hypothetical protein Ao3042_09906 [Aspergillus oryzae 3.042]KDE82236.1 hypothetical protein AO1008_08754 [Aspergillus oryzae 100-8]BAE55763.1 unnamed protein product [Aspergillus oryzae RIB40]|eukprot:EIT74006.1 hypothetical protein Ao3042_09906 [Aspergillus oryzae 3.042]
MAESKSVLCDHQPQSAISQTLRHVILTARLGLSVCLSALIPSSPSSPLWPKWLYTGLHQEFSHHILDRKNKYNKKGINKVSHQSTRRIKSEPLLDGVRLRSDDERFFFAMRPCISVEDRSPDNLYGLGPDGEPRLYPLQ